MRLSPIDPEKGIAMSGIGMSYLMLERFDEALQWGEQALREMPNYGSSHRAVVGALVGLQRLDEARGGAPTARGIPHLQSHPQRKINPWRDEVFGERYPTRCAPPASPTEPRVNRALKSARAGDAARET